MAQVSETGREVWTAAEVVERFGPIPLYRVRMNPPAGKATVEDVVRMCERKEAICELIDGFLLEKTVGAYESYLAMLMGQFLGPFVRERNLGLVLGADALLELAPDQIRIPDVCFISWDRLGGPELPSEPAWGLAPDLAVEIISKHNTRREMERKLEDYFGAGVRLVWYVYPQSREVRVYTAPGEETVLGEQRVLDGGNVLPGFQVSLKEFFTKPRRA
jgi:Uma2 family endonuclease